MAILGARGFIEWLVVAEDEILEEMFILAENLPDKGSAERWGRIIGDERLHIEHLKKELLGMESWEMGGGGGVRDVVFGVNDGLVSILALIASVFFLFMVGAAKAVFTRQNWIRSGLEVMLTGIVAATATYIIGL
jgi:hypothetical protein